MTDTSLILDLSLIAAGIALLSFGAVQCRRQRKLLRHLRSVYRSYAFALGLVLFFITGYAGFGYSLFIHQRSFYDTLVSVIFVFGAMFVVVILWIDRRLTNSLLEATKRMADRNVSMEKLTLDLQERSKQLGMSEENYRNKNRDLEKTLEDLYCLRLSMEHGPQGETVAAENQALKQQLDAVRSESEYRAPINTATKKG